MKQYMKASGYMIEYIKLSEVKLVVFLNFCIHVINLSFSRVFLSSPIGQFPFYLLIETSGSNEEHDEEKQNNFLEKVLKSGMVEGGTVTNEPAKIKVFARYTSNCIKSKNKLIPQTIWELRERVSTAILSDGYVFKYDISLPLSHFYDIVPATKKRLGSLAKRVCGYGHLGDSNLHLNVSCNEFSPKLYGRIEPWVYEYTSQLRGSVSAEHGIGFLKTKYLHLSKSDNAISTMRDLKTLMDPNGILNPYKVLPLKKSN